ncbi:MAG: tripartite tricarboxylate transporter substrate binding protein [Proteobacteria bacterium]|nr:tripartite tricarboxylate transporter substrate binding protein [Burkholderiales bacterium]
MNIVESFRPRIASWLNRPGRRALVALAIVAFALMATPQATRAQAYPSQPITLIVPWPPGGGSDIAMRLVADAASKRMGVPVVVVNRPGAGGTIGLKEMASSKPDGYTIGMVATGAVFAQYNNANANALADFEPIAFFGEDAFVLSVNTKTSIKTVADYIAQAKANPGKLRNGNDQPGGSSHVAASMLERRLGLKLNKVPYAGYAPTVQALLSGEIDSVTVPPPDIAQHHKSGAVRAIGIAGTERSFMVPDVPTFREQGVDFVAGSWRYIAGPKGIPADRLAVLETRFLEVLRDKEFIEKARSAGFVVQPAGRTDTAKRLVAEDDAMYPVFLEAGLVRARQR